LFKKKEIAENVENKELIVCKEENFLKKILKKIVNFFKK